MTSLRWNYCHKSERSTQAYISNIGCSTTTPTYITHRKHLYWIVNHINNQIPYRKETREQHQFLAYIAQALPSPLPPPGGPPPPFPYLSVCIHCHSVLPKGLSSKARQTDPKIALKAPNFVCVITKAPASPNLRIFLKIFKEGFSQQRLTQLLKVAQFLRRRNKIF